ncbi:anion permease, partial [bacterium]|nr:anion permease [bacterium]
VEGKKSNLRGYFKTESISIIPEKAIKDIKLLKKACFVFSFVILGFFFHERLNVEPSIVALSGASFLLLLAGIHPDEVLREVEWSTLIFFASLFILVGSIEKAGVIDLVVHKVISITGNYRILIFIVLSCSAIFSAIIDNIPFVAAMIPVIIAMSSKLNMTEVNSLWWALSLGSCLGGNGTLIGASANIVIAGISEKTSSPIRFRDYLKYGGPLTIISIVLSGIYLLLFYSHS